MLAEELISLVKKIISHGAELQNVELKKAANGTPERLYDTLSSFANQTGGGIIIFGVDENNDFTVTGVYDAQDLQKKVTAQSMQMTPVIRPVFTVAQMESRVIVSAEIAECDIFDKPCFYTGAGRLRGSYIRVGDADMRMTEYEIYSYEAFKRKIQDELRAVPRADLSDLDKDLLELYLAKIRQMKPQLARLSKEKILQLQGIIEKDKPTLAGLMLLGEYPQGFFPQLSITAMVVPGNELGIIGENGERFIDNQRIEGTLPQMLREAMAFIRRNIRTSTIVDENGERADTTEYPMIAVREIILNALIHRDYSIHTESSPIRIILYSNRLEIENPGGLYGRITIDELGKAAADTRNPFIAGGMELITSSENRFSGIPIIRSEMKKSNLPPPIFDSKRGAFKVTLWNHQLISMTTKPAAKNIKKSISEDILAFCAIPRSRAEIGGHLGITSPAYLQKRYIRPLVTAGKLRLTIPAAPRSKLQKYVKA